MTNEDFKDARRKLGFTQDGLAAEWGMGKNGGTTIRRWENERTPLNPIAAYAITLMLRELDHPE